MPRARGPGRNIRRSGTAGRERRSSSRHPYRPSNANSGSLRRSTRIAEQSTSLQQQDQQELTGAPMTTDIARRTQTTRAPRSLVVDTDLSREPSRHRSRRTGIDGETNSAVDQGRRAGYNSRREALRYSLSSEDELPNYAMDVIIQPPALARPGRSLSPVVTVRLRSQMQDEGDSDVAHLLAVATLVAEHADRTPEQLQNALSGRRFDSIHPFPADEEDNRGAGFVSFPDLVIRDEGVYRIRVTLIKVRNNSENGSPIPDGGSNVQAVETNPIAVGSRSVSEGE